MEVALETLAALVTVFGWSFFSFWSAIPAGIALGLSPVLVAVTVTISYGSGAALVLLIGSPIRARVQRRLARDTSAGEAAQPRRMVVVAQQVWARYGLIGLGLLAPMTVGAQTGAVIGLSFGGRPWRLLISLTLGATAWAIVLTLATVLAESVLLG
ncbi:MAG: hypothetical protein GYB67_01690 [Chloroflexi bacterium]|nr:hypothetical protein [Chloroflexota bacterium]